MLFQFTSAIQAAIEAGNYVQVFNSAGVPLSLARDASTGKFVAQAVGMMAQNTPLAPLFSPVQMAMGAAQMYQTHQGFAAVQVGLQSIQSSLGVLQATTAFIGVGTVAVGVLSAVNLQQTLKKTEKGSRTTQNRSQRWFYQPQTSFKRPRRRN